MGRRDARLKPTPQTETAQGRVGRPLILIPNPAQKLPKGVWDEVLSGVKKIETQMEMEFGNPAKPLLVSVPSTPYPPQPTPYVRTVS